MHFNSNLNLPSVLSLFLLSSPMLSAAPAPSPVLREASLQNRNASPASASAVECCPFLQTESSDPCDCEATPTITPLRTSSGATARDLAHKEEVNKRQALIYATFYGATDDPTDQFQVYMQNGFNISIESINDISVSHILNSGGGECEFHGVDGAVVIIPEAGEMDVGPPQTIAWGMCTKT